LGYRFNSKFETHEIKMLINSCDNFVAFCFLPTLDNSLWKGKQRVLFLLYTCAVCLPHARHQTIGEAKCRLLLTRVIKPLCQDRVHYTTVTYIVKRARVRARKGLNSSQVATLTWLSFLIFGLHIILQTDLQIFLFAFSPDFINFSALIKSLVQVELF
jgi:hypothetical protein